MSEMISEAELLSRLMMIDKRLRLAVRRAIQSNPKLQRWVTEDDLKQEVLLRLIKACRVTAIADDAHFIHLMLLQLRRSIIDFHRKLFGPNGWAVNLKTDPKAVRVNQATMQEHPRNLITHGAPVTIEEWIDFHESVETLPEAEKAVFEMFFYGGFTDYEIAGILGCSDRTVRRHWMKARVSLQRLIDTDRERRQATCH